MGRDVALKVIQPEYAHQADFRKSFEDEARTIAALENRNIVPLYSYWQDGNGVFLVMRYISGGNLREVIDPHRPLSLEQTVRILAEVAEALSVAHENKIIHRDLKPENILLDENGAAYLTDFGIAERVTNTSDTPTVTVNSVLGTLAYISPEQIQSLAPSPQDDIYAFGIVLYEMLAGQHPFHDVPATAMMAKHLQDPLPDIAVVRPDLPRDVNEIIQRATRKTLNERYGSVSDLMDDLKAVAVGQPIAPFSKPSTPPAAGQTAAPKDRNRMMMLRTVRKWIDGMLEKTLPAAVLMELDLQPQANAVDNPWDTVAMTDTDTDETTLTSSSISAHFKEMNGKLLLLGDPDSGKTTLLLTLARALLDHAEQDEQAPIPVVFLLSLWHEDEPSFDKWLADQLHTRYEVPYPLGEQWIAEGKLTLLLDGLNEMAPAAREACVAAINAYRGAHGLMDMVVSSRREDYNRLSQQLKLSGAVTIHPPTDAQIEAYLDELGAEAASLRGLIRRDARLRELARTLPMLSIMLSAYRQHPGNAMPDFNNPASERYLLNLYVDRMFEAHQRQQDGGAYTEAETRRYLGWLAKHMRAFQIGTFRIERLQPSWLQPENYARYVQWLRWLHIPIMFAAYFLPLFILRPLPPAYHPSLYALGHGLAGALLGLIFVSRRYDWLPYHVLFGLVFGLGWSAAFFVVDGPAVGVLVWATLGLASCFDGAMTGSAVMRKRGTRQDQIVVVDRLRFAWSRVSVPRVVAGVFSGVALIFLVHGLLGAAQASLLALVLAAALVGGINGARHAYESGLTAQTAEPPIQPNQGIRNTLANANRAYALLFVQWFIMVGGGVSLVTSLALGVPLGLALGIAFGYHAWFSYAGYAALQHLALRRVLEREHAIPPDLADFLDHAAALSLLHKVGGGYVFVNRHLRDYFAALPAETDERRAA